MLSWLLNVPAYHKEYLKDGSAQTIACAATLRWELKNKLAISTSTGILTPVLPVQALTPEHGRLRNEYSTGYPAMFWGQCLDW